MGRLRAAGATAEFPVPTANSCPEGIATGPDGAVWFAEWIGNFAAGQIGRLALTVNSHDFNGDGKSDIALRDTSGNNAMWLMNGAQLLQAASLASAPTTWSFVSQRDFDGGGNAHFLRRDTSA